MRSPSTPSTLSIPTSSPPPSSSSSSSSSSLDAHLHSWAALPCVTVAALSGGCHLALVVVTTSWRSVSVCWSWLFRLPPSLVSGPWCYPCDKVLCVVLFYLGRQDVACRGRLTTTWRSGSRLGGACRGVWLGMYAHARPLVLASSGLSRFVTLLYM